MRIFSIYFDGIIWIQNQQNQSFDHRIGLGWVKTARIDTPHALGPIT